MATPSTSTSPTANNSNNAAADDPMTTSPSSPPVVTLQSLLPPLPDRCRRVYLLRHGETDWNALGKIQGGGYDIPLNTNGRSQANKAAAELDGIPLDVIASSSLSRAKETADILHARHDDKANGGVGIHRLVDPGFNEMSFGEWEGFASRYSSNVNETEVERFKDSAQRVKDDPDYAFPGGGESTRQVEERSVAALYKILDSTRQQNNQQQQQRHIAIVSHGRTNKVLIAATGLGDAQRFKEVKQSNVAVNVMDLDDTTGTWTIHVVNFIDHVRDNVIVRL